MKKSVSLLLLIMVCCCAQAQTIYVSGPQSGVWDADTVMVTGDVKVADSLRVLPGTVVVFEKFYGISVLPGTAFIAEGTVDDSIVFTVADTTGFSNFETNMGGWNGFQVYNADRFLLDYCVLQYGKAFSDQDWHGGALKIVRSKEVKILNSTLRYNAAHEHGGALSARDSRVQLSNCAINYNTVHNEDNMYLYGGGARFLNCEVEMQGMEFRGNEAPTIGGALSLDSCSVVLDRSVFVNNMGVNGGGLYLMRSNHRKCRLSNLVFDHNLSLHFGGGLALSDASPEMYNILVTDNTSEGVSCAGVFFYQESSPIVANCIIYGNYPDPEFFGSDTTQMWIWTYNEFAPEFYNCLIEGGKKYIHSWENIVVFQDIIDEDPLFVDAANHDFRLREESPCRDAGNEDTPPFITDGYDLAGMPRVLNNRVDIGPYEYSGASVGQYASPASFAKLVGNPLGARSRVVMDLDAESDVVLTLYSMVGRYVASKSFGACPAGRNELRIGDLVEGLASGVYLIKVSVNGNQCTLKTVK